MNSSKPDFDAAHINRPLDARFGDVSLNDLNPNSFDPEAETIKEECGVFGIFGMDDAASLTALGLHALQHRGQEACGIASFDGKKFHTERHLGLVGDNFTGADPSERLPGHISIGHNRYSTAGQTVLRNVQPLFSELHFGGFALAHNGHLTNAYTLREQLVEKGALFQSTSDTEVLVHLIARARTGDFVERFIEGVRQVDGGYAFVGMTSEHLIGARDRMGIRPLLIGRLGNSYILASETCAFDMIDAKFIREVEAGEVVVINSDGIRSFRAYPESPARPCIFEFVYFARPDSIVGGKSVYNVRKRMGQRLAQETPADVDVIIPVPDSGVPAAIGFSQETGIPFELGIIRNHYVGRTFIQPTQQIRDMGVKLKHSANRAMIEGKRVLLVDDSIVRGTTSTKIVRMIRAAGAKEVHFRSASPPIKHPDHYGIDMPTREKLIAANYGLEEMTEMLEVDSLGFLSIEGLYWAMGEKYREEDSPQYTDHCFTGQYPTPLVDRDRKLTSANHQLSFLVEVT